MCFIFINIKHKNVFYVWNFFKLIQIFSNFLKDCLKISEKNHLCYILVFPKINVNRCIAAVIMTFWKHYFTEYDNFFSLFQRWNIHFDQNKPSHFPNVIFTITTSHNSGKYCTIKERCMIIHSGLIYVF